MGRRSRRRWSPPTTFGRWQGTLETPPLRICCCGTGEALIHLDALGPDLATRSPHDALDRSARGTYVLLRAAIEHGVHRVVVGSSLTLLHAYPASWAVSEDWQPRPDVTDVRQLALHLTEQSARQFVFFEPLQVICLRFGEIVAGGTATAVPDWTRLHADDAVQAVEKALTAPLQLKTDNAEPGQGLPHGWRVFHIPGAGNTRVPLSGAISGLGYAPNTTSPRRGCRSRPTRNCEETSRSSERRPASPPGPSGAWWCSGRGPPGRHHLPGPGPVLSAAAHGPAGDRRHRRTRSASVTRCTAAGQGGTPA